MSRAGLEAELPAGPGHFVRALWGFEVCVRSLPAAENEFVPRRPRFAEANLWLPSSPLIGVPGAFTDYLFAACAHLSAHLRFGAPRFEIKSLKPTQIAIISLLEDARVERLAVAHYPGLARLWAPYHQARADGAKTSLSLLARLARALHDDSFLDDDAWVNKGRRLFLQARGEWHDAELSRRLGSALGNDLGQMRVQFNAKTYVVEPAYRDDNVGLWQFEQESSEDSPQFETEGVRRTESSSQTNRQREREQPEVRPALGSAAGEARSGLRLAAESEATPAARYPEWDYVIQRERTDFCSVFERSTTPSDAAQLTRTLSRHARARKHLDRAATRLTDRRAQRLRRLLDGDQIDLPGAVAAVVARESDTPLDPRIYRRVRFRLEPPALLLLLDLSESLNAVLPNSRTALLELAQSAAALLATSLAKVTGELAIHGFSSNGRDDVGYYRFKDFDDPYDEHTLARLAGMRAHLSTRLGCALRHAGRALAERGARRKLLLVVTDGEPSDIDVHEPNYLLFDAKYATLGNRRLGLSSFCIGLDPNAKESVERIFGAGNFCLLEQLEKLPQRVAELYQRWSA